MCASFPVCIPMCFAPAGGKGPLHYGVCSNFLKEVSIGDHVELFVRR